MDIYIIKLISNNICYGPEPSTTDEVEQHLTISSIGEAWFTGYNYDGVYGNYIIGREQQLPIGKQKAGCILSLISHYFNNEPPSLFATDIGQWELAITDAGGKEHKFKGSLLGEIAVGDIDLTDYIRESIPINNLLVFEDVYSDEDKGL